jgi:uncharacterized protein with ParB-like and HNH nuclease domain
MTNNDLRFEARDIPIKDLLFSSYKYEVPRYQRPYAWDIDQIVEFWEDIVGNDKSPFIGSVIMNFENQEETGKIDIIDGQQRILTITILASVLRDLAKPLDRDTAQLYQRHDIGIEDRTTGLQTFRVTAGDQTKDYFEKNIQLYDSNILEAETNNEEQKRIKKNYEYLYQKVQAELEKYPGKADKIKYLNSLRERISDLTVIRIEIHSEDEAYEIFETTNARGVDLSVADLLKNLIFRKIPATDQSDYAKQAWEEITENVEETNTEMKRFIRYYWTSRYSTVRQRKLFKEIKKETIDYRVLLEDLRKSADIFNKMIEGREEDWEAYHHGSKMFNALKAIRLMNVSQCYVYFLSILRNIDLLGTDPSRIFEQIENFTFQYNAICKMPTNKLEKLYGKHAKAIEDIVRDENKKRIPGNIQSAFSQLEKELKAELPTAEYFRSQFMNMEYRNSEQFRRLIGYILSKINDIYEETREQTIDFENVNIEHIMPQKPDKSWGLQKSDIKTFVNKLGNLTLIDKRINSKVGNKIVKDKLNLFEKSSLPINHKLIEELKINDCKWDKEAIMLRQQNMAEIARKEIWKI